MQIILGALLLPGIVKAQSLTIVVKNSSAANLSCKTQYIHGQGFEFTYVAKGASASALYIPTAISLCTGVEGLLVLTPDNDPTAAVSIYYDNPYIGKSSYSLNNSFVTNHTLAFTNVTWNSDAHVLSVEIVSANAAKAIQVTPIVPVKNGIVKGMILWNKKDILAPEAYPYGKAFSFHVMAPTQFVESNGPFTFERTGSYGGKNGYFQGYQSVGEATYTTTASYDPDYVEVHYTVTGVPTSLPLDIDVVTDYDKSRWTAGPQKPQPGNEYTFLVGTFPNTSKSAVTIENNAPVLGGVDFSCEGDWVKLDANGNIIGGGSFANKIASRKSMPVLPVAFLSNGAATRATSVMTAQPAATQTNQVQNKQVQGAVQKVRIKN